MEDPAEVDLFLGAHPSGQLITVGPDDVPDATLVPYVLDRPNGSGSGLRVLAHVARANDHWQRIGDRAAGLFVVTSANAYVSPSWYPSKQAHGRVVPTWSYSALHLRGVVRVHDDADWLREMVTRLTDIHEAGRENRWSATDAPEAYLTGQLRAIVGIELIVQQVEAKAKLTQNRSLEDRWGTIAELEAEASSSSHEVAAAMRAMTPETNESAETEGSREGVSQDHAVPPPGLGPAVAHR
jgi:transcriptional regulator